MPELKQPNLVYPKVGLLCLGFLAPGLQVGVIKKWRAFVHFVCSPDYEDIQKGASNCRKTEPVYAPIDSQVAFHAPFSFPFYFPLLGLISLSFRV